jgi:DNA-binding transcriptional LysR family regulator
MIGRRLMRLSTSAGRDNQLECMQMFVRVVEREGFSGLRFHADVPGKGFDSISHTEAHLGVQLLSRTTRCNAHGRGGAYYEHWRILADIADTEAGFASADRPHGRLRIDVCHADQSTDIAGHWQVSQAIQWNSSSCTEHLFDSRQDGMDVMFRLGPLEDSNLIAAHSVAS